jgi:hypothetical protein
VVLGVHRRQHPGQRLGVGDHLGGALHHHRLGGVLGGDHAAGVGGEVRALRDPRLLENQNAPSSQTPQTGMACGRPSGQLVATQ